MRHLTGVALVAGASAGSADLKRARSKVPGPEYKGDDQSSMSKVLNGHLRRAEPDMTRSCDEWTTQELQDFMAHIADHRSPHLTDIYTSSNDRRAPTFSGIDEHKTHWRDVNRMAPHLPEFEVVARESHCREAVMWWVHHLEEDSRVALRKEVAAVPLLPEGDKKHCKGESLLCVSVNKPNSCDWCHGTQALHDAGVPGNSVPDALEQNQTLPDDGNPHNWDRIRRCDQNVWPRCQLCEGVGGRCWDDAPEACDITPCEIVGTPDQIDPATVAPPLYPKKFTVQNKDGSYGAYSDTLIGWKLDSDQQCVSFFPQNDSIPDLCYRDQSARSKWYDIENERARTDYTLNMFPAFPNSTSSIIQSGWQMWVVNHIDFGTVNESKITDQCVCTNPSGQHCEDYLQDGKPCYSFLWHWDTFATAQYLGREKIGVEWIHDHGVGESSEMMELDHFIMWSHHVWTDPISRRIVRAWKSFNGLQNYAPDAWTDGEIVDVDGRTEEEIFEVPPPECRNTSSWRINCDDDGNYQKTPAPLNPTHYGSPNPTTGRCLDDELELQIGESSVCSTKCGLSQMYHCEKDHPEGVKNAPKCETRPQDADAGYCVSRCITSDHCAHGQICKAVVSSATHDPHSVCTYPKAGLEWQNDMAAHLQEIMLAKGVVV